MEEIMQNEMPRVLLVGLDTGEDLFFSQSMKELSNLAEACNMEVAGSIVQKNSDINKTYYIGPGKVLEVKELAESLSVDTVIFDNALSPSQLKNLQDEIELAIMDRTTLILEIFATRAMSKEAMLQVETARLQYILPRLTGLGKALSRQGGTSGSKSSRGAGEKKLELDRRYLESRLAECRRELKAVSEKRITQRKKRTESGIPRVALVGYTNAGKSTLLNAFLEEFSKEENAKERKVMAKDMLFATLDTTVRKIAPVGKCPLLLSDTVGFIHKLPHNLIEAFKSTLEETREADLLLMVVDAGDENHKEHIEVTNNTLMEIGAGNIPVLYVYNKADKIMEPEKLPVIREDKVYVSAKQKIGLEALYDTIVGRLSKGYHRCNMLVPFDRGEIVARLMDNGAVLNKEYTQNGVFLELNVNEEDYNRYQEFVVKN